MAVGIICGMLNAESDYSLQGQQKYIYVSLNPNPKPYPKPEIT